MSTVAMTPDQQSQLQAEVQRELEKREWAEPNDNVMAEYITVLIANGSDQSRVQTEMDDLVGSDFDPRFLDWLFGKASDIQRSASVPAPSPAAPVPAPVSAPSTTPAAPPAGGSRLLNTALAPLGQDNKRKAEGGDDGARKRLSDVGAAPSGPRAMGQDGRNLADRLGGRQQMRGGMQVRGVAGGRQPGGPGRGMGMGGMGGIGPGMGMGMGQMGFQQGFRPGMMQPGFGAGPGFFQPGQQEMMAQMMMMQANMAQMGEMMAKMAEGRDAPQAPSQPVRPTRPPAPVKLPHGTKLGSHSVSAITPKASSTPGPIPDKPSSAALCRYGVGCSNARCQFSHPSPVADEKTGMVLSEEACENGKKCKDPECTKSHVSPAAVLGEQAGPSRLLCKYQNCTNPSCPFRHEDENGNPIPPPALTAAKAGKDAANSTSIPKAQAPVPQPQAAGSDNEDGDGDVEVVMSSRGLMDGALDDSRPDKPCRYGERCTRSDCKFTHPASRVIPKARGSYTPRGGAGGAFGKRSTNGVGGGTGYVSKKFGAAAQENKLDPKAGEFVPGGGAGAAAGEKELEVTS